VADAGRPFRLSDHAQQVIERRRIDVDWVESVFTAPEKTEQDALDPQLRHALGRIEAYGDRVLRVVYNPAEKQPVIVTAFFDRSMKGNL